MKLIVEVLFQTNKSRILDADLSDDELVVLVDDEMPIVYWNERTLRLPFHLSSPFIRLLDSETFVVVDVTLEQKPVNAWVIDKQGNVIHSFHAGNAIGSVACNDTGIWIGYVDEGVFG